MKTANFLTSSCRYCRYYQGEGRRGGNCQQLGVPVKGQWKACTLAASPFNSVWEDIEKIVDLEHALSLTYPAKSLAERTAQTATRARGELASLSVN
jgi:hypothetical protein